MKVLPIGGLLGSLGIIFSTALVVFTALGIVLLADLVALASPHVIHSPSVVVCDAPVVVGCPASIVSLSALVVGSSAFLPEGCQSGHFRDGSFGPSLGHATFSADLVDVLLVLVTQLFSPSRAAPSLAQQGQSSHRIPSYHARKGIVPSDNIGYVWYSYG